MNSYTMVLLPLNFITKYWVKKQSITNIEYSMLNNQNLKLATVLIKSTTETGLLFR